MAEHAKAQEEVIEAMTQLQAEIDGLERIPAPDPEQIDITELEKLINHAKTYEEAHYTEASFAHLQKAISHAEEVVENAETQAEVTEAITQLQKALAGLENPGS
ncbi:hypothetical protein [Paracerasibacillus soli]|uniref:hypothetical protein n=1 Tax=Paracerasibacillus soli TaxID=480284 RepID=UPI00387E1A2F